MRIERMVQTLIQDDQPFILIKGTNSLLTNYSAYYELVIWQTIDRPNNSMYMTRELFRELIRRYNLKLLVKNKEGEIYGVNDRLRDLRKFWRRTYNTLERERRRAQTAYLTGGGKKNKEVVANYKKAKSAINTFNSRFKKENNIKSLRCNDGGRRKEEE